MSFYLTHGRGTLEDGLYIDQFCKKCGYNWQTEIIDMRNTLKAIYEGNPIENENLGHQAGDLFINVIKKLNVICPQCGNDDTIWALAVNACHIEYTREEIIDLMDFYNELNELFNERAKVSASRHTTTTHMFA
jgi:predicted nucleic-acid-binding Zn-ribbon protein